MFGIGIGVLVFGYWRLFKWNRERRWDHLYLLNLHWISDALIFSEQCFCTRLCAGVRNPPSVFLTPDMMPESSVFT